MTTKYLTRAEVAELYPISVHTLAKLASEGMGPRFYKPTDKCLYRAEDVEAWIEAAVVMPASPMPKPDRTPIERNAVRSGRGRTAPRPTVKDGATMPGTGRKSLPPSPNSWLLRKED